MCEGVVVGDGDGEVVGDGEVCVCVRGGVRRV